jgi:anaerobic magnesium-protoporphyrin IX monomethyl ester cyclase
MSERLKERDDFRVLIVYPNLPLMLIPSIAIALFTRIFKTAGYRVDLFDTTHYASEEESSSEMRAKMNNVRRFSITDDLGITIKTDLLEDFRRKVESFKPDFMIFSVVEDSFKQTLRLLAAVDDLNVPHLVGGVFPTYAPDLCISFDEVQMIGLGEGERSALETAEAVRLGKPRTKILGTWFKDDAGVVHKNAKDPLVDINRVRPDFSLFDESRFYRPMGGRVFKMIPVESFRGCPYSCTYCNSPSQRVFSKENDLGSFLRRKSMDVLREELVEYRDLYNPNFFYFVDDVFLARPKSEIFEFCDMYEEFKLPFWFNTRSETCEPDVMARLKEVGCYRISFGIECGNEQYRREVLRRKITNEELIDRFAFIAQSGIAFSLNIIIGMPGETRELTMDSVRLIRSIRGYDALTVSIFTPYHGTVLRDVAVKNSWMDAKAITTHTTARSLLKMPEPYLSADDIDGLAFTFPFYTYFPESEWPRIRRAEIPDAEGLALREEFSRRYSEEFLGEDQDAKRALIFEGGSGCRTNPKDAFRFSPMRLSAADVQLLTTMAS